MSKVRRLNIPWKQRGLRALKRVLREYGIPPEQYRVGGYAEERVCLEQTKDGWEVYTGERGNRYERDAHDDLMGACMEMLDRLAKSDCQAYNMQHSMIWEMRRKNKPAKFINGIGGYIVPAIIGRMGWFETAEKSASERGNASSEAHDGFVK